LREAGKLSKNTLNVVDFDLERYSIQGAPGIRKGTAYCLRKGRGRKLIHDTDDSILIDGLSKNDVIDVLRSVKTFYSYDLETAYSQFAALCGCDSVVVPDPGLTEQQWRQDARYRYGIAYGSENIEEARSTVSMLRPFMKELELDSVRQVLSFMNEVNDHFTK
jgi:hypothetical protein